MEDGDRRHARRGYIAGRRDVDPDQSVTVDVPDDIAEDNTAVLLSTLRERLVAALDHHDAEGASDRVDRAIASGSRRISRPASRTWCGAPTPAACTTRRPTAQNCTG